MRRTSVKDVRRRQIDILAIAFAGRKIADVVRAAREWPGAVVTGSIAPVLAHMLQARFSPVR